VEGKVDFAGTSGGSAYGNYVVVQDATGERTAHCHLSSITVGLGKNVAAGQKLGLVGNTGNTTGAHVHVERRHRPFTYGSDEKPARDLPRPADKMIKRDGRGFVLRLGLLARLCLEQGQARLAAGTYGSRADSTLVGDEVAKFQIQKCGDPGDRLISLLQTKALLEHAGLTGFKVT
jgi:murein DD-endopeptidase MepM/ murein hydrolase activator NlpD